MRTFDLFLRNAVDASFEFLNLLRNVLVVLYECLLNALQEFLVAGNSLQDYGLSLLKLRKEFAEVCS